MANPITGTSVYMIPGQTVKIRSSLTVKNDFGWFAAQEIPQGHMDDYPYHSSIINGFVLEDTRIGEIKPASDEEGTVILYTHQKVAPNAIWFFSGVGEERGLVNVISVPIHDHSTIVHGGPAYGTYFDDDVERV